MNASRCTRHDDHKLSGNRQKIWRRERQADQRATIRKKKKILLDLDQGFPNFQVIGTLWTIYRFARVPPKFSHIFGCEAQLALMHNLLSIARQPITFLLSLLKPLKLIILV